MKIFTVYFYYSQWSDSAEYDRLYFSDFNKAKKHERDLLEKYNNLIDDEPEDYFVYFEEIDVVD